MLKLEEKLDTIINELQGNVVGLNNLTKVLLDSFKKKLKEGTELTDLDIEFVNEIWLSRDKEKRRCNFCKSGDE